MTANQLAYQRNLIDKEMRGRELDLSAANLQKALAERIAKSGGRMYQQYLNQGGSLADLLSTSSKPYLSNIQDIAAAITGVLPTSGEWLTGEEIRDSSLLGQVSKILGGKK